MHSLAPQREDAMRAGRLRIEGVPPKGPVRMTLHQVDEGFTSGDQPFGRSWTHMQSWMPHVPQQVHGCADVLAIDLPHVGELH